MSIREKFSAAKRGVKKGLSAPFKAVGAADDAFHRKSPTAYHSTPVAMDLALVGVGVAVAVTSGGIAVPVLGGVAAFAWGANAVQDTKKLKKHLAQKKNLPPNGF